MMNYKNFIFIIFTVGLLNVQQKQNIPEGFVKISKYIPDLNVELRYYTTNNFVGDTIDGYRSNTLYLTEATAKQLKLVQDELQQQNLCLKVYDGYRPQRAVNHFIRWAKNCLLYTSDAADE